CRWSCTDPGRLRDATGRDGRRWGRTGPGEEPSTWACRPAGHGRIVGPVRKDAPITSADTPSVDERLHDLDQRLVARIAEITRDELAGRRREQARISPETAELADRVLLLGRRGGARAGAHEGSARCPGPLRCGDRAGPGGGSPARRRHRPLPRPTWPAGAARPGGAAASRYRALRVGGGLRGRGRD